MNKKQKNTARQRKKTEKIIFLLGFTSLVFMVATYAWFIGITQVVVDEFEIEVKSSEGLTISLDAKVYGSNITIGESQITTEIEGDYPNHRNHWAKDLEEGGRDNGLIPISTSGEMDQDNGVLKLFSKSSIATINGQYMLRSEQIPNTTQEQAGYIAFDMFIKNSSGEVYGEDFSPLDAEGIYLLRDSVAYLEEEDAEAGKIGGDGIENSIRTAFMLVGRVNMTAAPATAQAIGCTDQTIEGSGKITGLCNRAMNEAGNTPEVNVDNSLGLTWNIWEPNERAHNEEAIAHIRQVCKKRTDADTYSGACNEITDDTEYDTYTVNSQIVSSDKVNIYDGHNDFADVSNKLEVFDTFTDADKLADPKQEFFYLAPNSVTKIRVYIYLEGQDLDNYDLGQIGRKIKMRFGFTKDRYEGIDAPEAPTPSV